MTIHSDALAGCATHEQVKRYLETVAVWTARDNALYLNVNNSFYRRHILPLSNHPTPVDATQKNLQWFASDMIPFLSDTSNLKRKVA